MTRPFLNAFLGLRYGTVTRNIFFFFLSAAPEFIISRNTKCSVLFELKFIYFNSTDLEYKQVRM